MPRRKRPKSPSSAPARPTSPSSAAPGGAGPASSDDDAIERFAAALRASEERERAEQAKRREQAARADELAAARRDLDAAIEAVRAAKRRGRGTVEADAAWKAAKARVLELETGERPDWAGQPPADAESAPDETATDEVASEIDEPEQSDA